MASNNSNYAEISDEKPFPKIKPIFTLDKNLPKVNNIIITDRLFGQCNVCLLYYKELFFTDKCRHYLCKKCMEAWIKIKRICPVCKQNFSQIFKK